MAKQEEYTEKMVEYLPLFRMAAKLTQNQVAKRLATTRIGINMIYFETKKRKMPFKTYLVLVYIFRQYDDSKKLMESFELYDEDFLLHILSKCVERFSVRINP